VDGSPQRRFFGRKEIVEILVQARQSLRSLVGFEPEESGGRIAFELGAVEV
jgi:hypothetical protein